MILGGVKADGEPGRGVHRGGADEARLRRYSTVRTTFYR